MYGSMFIYIYMSPNILCNVCISYVGLFSVDIFLTIHATRRFVSLSFFSLYIFYVLFLVQSDLFAKGWLLSRLLIIGFLYMNVMVFVSTVRCMCRLMFIWVYLFTLLVVVPGCVGFVD